MAETKRYKITQKGADITIQTDTTLNGAIITLLRTLFRHLNKNKPELVTEYVEMVNKSYELSQIKPKISDPEPEDFDFYRRMMETRYVD